MVEIDGRKSTQIGAENLIAFRHGISSMLDRYLKPRWFEEDKKSRKAIGIFYRLSKTVLLDNVIDHLAILTQHEVFGHGSCYREFGYKNNSYSLSLFPPYGNGNGYAISGGLISNRTITTHERIMVIIGGSEANTQLSKSIRSKWLHRGSIKYREAVFYLFSANDLSWYIIRTKQRRLNSSNNDIIAYLRTLNSLEGFQGYSWDVLRESFHEMGYTIHLSITPWARAMSYVTSEKEDILFPTGKNTERKRIFHYSEEPVNQANFLVYVRADDPTEWKGLESLRGLVIGV